MLTRLMVTLTLVAFVGVPSALAGGDCPFGHKTTAQTADATPATQESTTSTTAADLPQSTAPSDATVTVAEAPKDETAQD